MNLGALGMRTRRAFLFLALPSFALTQNKRGDYESRLHQCIADQSASLERESAPFHQDSMMNVAIEAADFDEAAAYRLAVADTIHEHFSHWAAIDPAAKARVDIRGGRITSSGLQLIPVNFGWKDYKVATLETGKPVGILEGFFTFKSAAEVLSGTHSDRVGRVREIVFGLLSDIEKERAQR
jgi:hypothetical protein